MSKIDEEKLLNVFPACLAAARQRADLSQSGLARLVRTIPSVISNLERGERKPSLAMVMKLADALGTSVDELLGREPRPADPDVDRLVKAVKRLPASDVKAVVDMAERLGRPR